MVETQADRVAEVKIETLAKVKTGALFYTLANRLAVVKVETG